MATIDISRRELQDLSDKLEEFGKALTESQQVVLYTILGLVSAPASDQMEKEHAGAALRPNWSPTELPERIVFTVPDSLQLPGLATAFDAAFRPGGAARFEIPGKGLFSPYSLLAPPTPECICKAPEGEE